LSYLASVLMENRHALIVASAVRSPSYNGERDAALDMLSGLGSGRRWNRCTLGADKGYDTGDFVAGVRELGAVPHVAQNIHSHRHRSAIDARTVRHPGYAVSQQK